jgi:hypothetical protein
MNKEEIITRAATKAIANGWREDEFRSDKRLKWPPTSIKVVEDRDYYANSGWWIESNEVRHLSAQICQSDGYEDLIFDHGFAKALWGEVRRIKHSPGLKVEYFARDWQHHLQQMVVATDPIKYLGDNLPE